MLIVKVPRRLANFALDWELLPNKNFPIILHSVLTPSRSGPDGSFYNAKEVKVVEFYVKYLLNQGIKGEMIRERDIGILTPYTAQRDKIKQALSRYIDIAIGTVEYFSNRERKIMIISTVRSSPQGKSNKVIGFLKNEKV
jgi:helicase MOV-10